MKDEFVKKRLVDFMWVYYGPEISKKVSKNPSLAIQILRDTLKRGVHNENRLRVYVSALNDAVAVGVPTP